MKLPSRLLISWVVGAISINFTFLCMSHVVPSSGIGATFIREIEIFPFACLFILLLLIPIYIFFVIPIAITFQRYEVTSLTTYLAAGFLVGCLTIFFYSVLLSTASSETFMDHIIADIHDAKVVAAVIVGGTVTGAAYWFQLQIPEV